MELGEWIGGWIIENADNRGSTVYGRTKCLLRSVKTIRTAPSSE